jgi:hypothetical protein
MCAAVSRAAHLSAYTKTLVEVLDRDALDLVECNLVAGAIV